MSESLLSDLAFLTFFPVFVMGSETFNCDLLDFGVKVEDGEIIDDAEVANNVSDTAVEGSAAVNDSDRKLLTLQQSGWSRRDGNQRPVKKVPLHSNCKFY